MMSFSPFEVLLTRALLAQAVDVDARECPVSAL